ncbi:hypothetical protein LCGC14_2753820, partial [marine sediment metagenome]
NYENYELDVWYSLLIKSVELTFTYEKKIDQFTSLSWNQKGEKISDISTDTIIINEAKLNFKYKIDELWNIDLSPNSEIRIFINNVKLSETIKLSEANLSLQEGKSEGFDVTSLIPYNTELTLSIQVYLADEFRLNESTTISIDDVYLNISYTVIFPDTQTNLHVFFNGINKTLNPIFEIPRNTTLNITVIYPDDNGVHISGASVKLSGNFTGILIENVNLGQYTILKDTSNLSVGEFRFNIVAHRIHYEARKISPILIVTGNPTLNLELYLNGENKTSDPYFDVAINKLLEITIKYKDLMGNHIPDATVQIIGEGIEETLIEDPGLEQYSITINTSIKLIFGQNDLIINAQEKEFQEQTINPRINVRKINTEITPVLGSNKIKILPGGRATILVYIYDTDFETMITGAVVGYVWENGEGSL